MMTERRKALTRSPKVQLAPVNYAKQHKRVFGREEAAADEQTPQSAMGRNALNKQQRGPRGPGVDGQFVSYEC